MNLLNRLQINPLEPKIQMIKIVKKKRNIEIKTVRIEVSIFNFITKLPFKKEFSFLELIINFIPLTQQPFHITKMQSIISYNMPVSAERVNIKRNLFKGF